jgi:hypothetical protein
MSNVETAIEEMIQSCIDEQDLVCRLDAEQYTDQCISDCEDSISELIVRIEALEAKPAPAAEEQEPRPVNQIDWIMTTHGLIAGYDSKATLEAYVRSVLPADQSHQAEMLIAMVLTTARNIINKKLEAES